MITCVICEDEEIQRKKIKKYITMMLKEFRISYKILEFDSGQKLLNAYPNQADILFLDIQMEELSGMETAKQIRTFDTDVEIIFVTGFNQFMQQGYEVNARRYLIKPIEYNDFVKQVEPCIENIMNRQENYIWIRSGHLTYKVGIDTILYVETYGRQVNVYTTNKVYSTYMTISSIEKELQGNDFFRCQKAILINLRYVDAIGTEMVLLNNNEIPVSRLRMKALRKELAKIIGEI